MISYEELLRKRAYEIFFTKTEHPISILRLETRADKFYERVKDKPSKVLIRYFSKLAPVGLSKGIGNFLYWNFSSERIVRYASTYRAILNNTRFKEYDNNRQH